MIVDMHCHYVSPRVLAEIERNGERYGVRNLGSDDGRPRIAIAGRVNPNPLLAALHDLERRQEVMAEHGIEREVLSTTLDHTGYALPADQGVAWARLINDSIAADLRDAATGRFSALATLPLQDPPAAAAELQRACGTLGYHGAVVGTHVNGRNFDDPALAPVWAATQEAGVPIIIHPAFVVETPRIAKYHHFNLLANPYDTLIAAASLIFGGVCDRYPDLKVVLVHGGGHLPYQAGRLTHGWEHNANARVSLQRPPVDYLKWFYYDTILYWPPALRFLASIVGVERIMLGSDYPYDMCPPRPRQIVLDADFTAAEQEQIFGENSIGVFRLR